MFYYFYLVFAEELFRDCEMHGQDSDREDMTTWRRSSLIVWEVEAGQGRAGFRLFDIGLWRLTTRLNNNVGHHGT